MVRTTRLTSTHGSPGHGSHGIDVLEAIRLLDARRPVRDAKAPRREFRRVMRAIIKEAIVSPRHREIVWHYLVESRSSTVVAAAFDCSAANVRVILHRSGPGLRQAIADRVSLLLVGRPPSGVSMQEALVRLLGSPGLSIVKRLMALEFESFRGASSLCAADLLKEDSNEL